MKLSKYDRVILRYNLLLNLERIPAINDKDIWMQEHSRYILNKLFKMEKKDMEETIFENFDFVKHEYEGETIYHLKKRNNIKIDWVE